VGRPATQEEWAAIQYDLDEWSDAALNQLIAGGCDRGELKTLLVRLRRASETTTWSKADLEDAANRVSRTAKTLRRLQKWGEARNLHLADDSERWLSERSADLQTLTERLRERAPDADKRDNPRLGRAQARLIAYVRQKTASPQYAHLALLISAATHKDRDGDTLRKWWANNKKKYANLPAHDR